MVMCSDIPDIIYIMQVKQLNHFKMSCLRKLSEDLIRSTRRCYPSHILHSLLKKTSYVRCTGYVLSNSPHLTKHMKYFMMKSKHTVEENQESLMAPRHALHSMSCTTKLDWQRSRGRTISSNTRGWKILCAYSKVHVQIKFLPPMDALKWLSYMN